MSKTSVAILYFKQTLSKTNVTHQLNETCITDQVLYENQIRQPNVVVLGVELLSVSFFSN